MKLSASDLRELADSAIAAAGQAAEMIARSRPRAVEYKAGARSIASQVVTEIDRRSEDLILTALAPSVERFALGLLTEEQADDRGRLTADYFWCIDPLDGTLPFVEGNSGYAVSIALVGRDGTPWIGVVHDPVESTVLSAIAGAGAFRNGRPWPLEPPVRGEALSVFADRSFLRRNDYDLLVERLDEHARRSGLTGLRLHATGGAVMNACGVLANPPACYFKYPSQTGGGSLWDFAATACLFHEVGALATDMHGGPLDLNRSDSSLMNHRGVLFATDEVLAERIRSLRA